jgi:hypothetical protein
MRPWFPIIPEGIYPTQMTFSTLSRESINVAQARTHLSDLSFQFKD